MQTCKTLGGIKFEYNTEKIIEKGSFGNVYNAKIISPKDK